jgi:iron(III) transport system substrate-binding protein
MNSEIRMTKRRDAFLVSDSIRQSGFVIRAIACLCVSVFIFGPVLSCGRSENSRQQIVLYTSIDEPIARPIIERFETQTGIDVVLVTDTEANKSVGLAERLRAERDRPRADVWWGNEPFHTVNLADEGLFAAYASPAAADVPAMFRDPGGRWAGIGLRARVIVAAPGAVDVPQTLESFAARTRVALARPTAGTTAGHIAALYVLLGDAAADAWLRRLHAGGAKMLGGNGPVAEAVGRGEFAFGLTDNDDVANVRREGVSATQVLPDPEGHGTLMIPTTVALVAGRPENADARRLVDHLVSRETEAALIAAEFAGWSVRGGAGHPRAMAVNYTAVAKRMPDAVRRAVAILEGRGE